MMTIAYVFAFKWLIERRTLILEAATIAETPTNYMRRLMGSKEANATFSMKVWFGNYLLKQATSKKQQEGFRVGKNQTRSPILC